VKGLATVVQQRAAGEMFRWWQVSRGPAASLHVVARRRAFAASDSRPEFQKRKDALLQRRMRVRQYLLVHAVKPL